MDARVGDVEARVGEVRFAKEEDIDIDDPGGVADGLGFAAQFFLDGLCEIEEGERVVSRVVELDGGVKKAG